MKISVHSTLDAWANAASQEITNQIAVKPDSSLGLSTGATMLPLYQTLVEKAFNGSIDFSRIQTFNVDEYASLPRTHPKSCYARMQAQFFGSLHIPETHIHFLNGVAENIEQECRAYEEIIQQAGGLDLLVLGIGENGHLGFNEPGTSFDSTTHVAEITPDTQITKADFFEGLEKVPHQGLTMGLKTIMEAHKIMLLARGEEKADIVSRALTGSVTDQVPASILQLHKDLTVILDRTCARHLSQ